MIYDWTTPWRDLPAGRDLDARVSETVGIHVHHFRAVSANTFICTRLPECSFRGPGGSARGPHGYSTEPRDAARVFEWISEQGWSWEVSYRWGLGYRASITRQHESPFTFTSVEDCPSWLVAICRVALDIADGLGG